MVNYADSLQENVFVTSYKEGEVILTYRHLSTIITLILKQSIRKQIYFLVKN